MALTQPARCRGRIAQTFNQLLSLQQKDQIPMIVYSEHNYAPQGLASVMLNGKRLQSGQRADTVEVIDILRDSVILRVDGIEFRLKALNTWVNL